MAMHNAFLDRPDWDRPSVHNSERCAQFRFGKTGSLVYRYYLPQEPEGAPIVLFLHGADVVGNDNESQLIYHDIGTMFAKKQWQEEHPCIIIAPQYGRGSYWSRNEIQNTIFTIIEDTAAAYNADRSRIYVYGYSAGGVGCLSLLKSRPELFAAAIPICGATDTDGLGNLAKVPLWLLHAEDDGIVLCSYGSMHLGSKDLFGKMAHEDRVQETKGKAGETLYSAGENLRYTELPAGFMEREYGVNPHCSWVYMSDKNRPELREWMFSKRRDTAAG